MTLFHTAMNTFDSDRLRKLKREALRRLITWKDVKENSFRKMPSGVVAGWKIIFTYEMEESGQKFLHISAALHPQARSSGLVDWGRLGKILALAGAPSEPVNGWDEANKTPSAAHHFRWPVS